MTSCLLRIQTRHDVYLRSLRRCHRCSPAICCFDHSAVSLWDAGGEYNRLVLNGAAFVVLTAKGADRMMVLAMTGILGGFTTFSLDTFKLIEDGRMIFAGGYILASVMLSLAAVFGGIVLARGVWG